MTKIPKIIHYCWLSGEAYPELIQKCMDSWKEVLSDYEFVCWDTKKFDVNSCVYTKEAFEAKKYAFVSDYIRLYALYNYGGIYLDTDIEVLKKFDPLLNNRAFTCFENSYSVAAWIFGSEKGNPIFKEFLDHYEGRKFLLPNGECDLTPNPYPITKTCIGHGLQLKNVNQELDNITVFTEDYFCPYDHISRQMNITDNTYCIHYFNAAWFSEKKKKRFEQRRNIEQKFGKKIGLIYYGIQTIVYEGWTQFIKELKYFAKKY